MHSRNGNLDLVLSLFGTRFFQNSFDEVVKMLRQEWVTSTVCTTILTELFQKETCYLFFQSLALSFLDQTFDEEPMSDDFLRPHQIPHGHHKQ